MTHSAPPFDGCSWLRAWNETWGAALDPQGFGGRLREARLARLIAAALRDSPLYARRSRGAVALADFAPVSKAELMHGFDDWATDRRITLAGAQAHLAGAGIADAWLGRYLLWTSSGTSGVPGLFVQDAASLAAYDAIEALRLRGSGAGVLGLWSVGRRCAYVGALGGPYAGHVAIERVRRLAPLGLAPRLELMSVLEPISGLVQRLQAFQPDVLITYPSCAAALALEQARGALRLRLDELWLGGEQLTPGQRGLVRSAFGCRLRNSYGASEFYSIAFECSHAQLHLNGDWVILEPVDARGRAAAGDAFSHGALLTNLANRTQPLLRYALPDRIRYAAAPCACGSAWPVIEVQGRCGDTLDLPGPEGRIRLLPLALETAIEEDAGVTQFQLLLRSDTRLELRLEAGAADAAAALARARRAVLAFLAGQGLRGVHVVCSRAAVRRQSGSGKLRRVVDARAPGAEAPVRA